MEGSVRYCDVFVLFQTGQMETFKSNVRYCDFFVLFQMKTF